MPGGCVRETSDANGSSFGLAEAFQRLAGQIAGAGVLIALAHDFQLLLDRRTGLFQLHHGEDRVATDERVGVVEGLGQRVGDEGSSSPTLPSLSTAWRRTFGLGLCRSATHDFTSRPPARIGPLSVPPQPDKATVPNSTIRTASLVSDCIIRMRDHLQYESELTISPPARVPSACWIRLDGVYRVEPSGLTPASPRTFFKKWTEPSAKRTLAPPG